MGEPSLPEYPPGGPPALALGFALVSTRFASAVFVRLSGSFTVTVSLKVPSSVQVTFASALVSLSKLQVAPASTVAPGTYVHLYVSASWSGSVPEPSRATGEPSAPLYGPPAT